VVINAPTTNARVVGRLVRFVHGEQTGTKAALRGAGFWRSYALRRKSPARTRARNCSGVWGGVLGAAFGFTTAGAAAFAALRASRSASCLAARSFASASSLGRRAVKGDSLVIAKYGLAVDRRHFLAVKRAERVRKRPAHRRADLARDTDRQWANVLALDRNRERPFFPAAPRVAPGPPWCRDLARSDIETPCRHRRLYAPFEIPEDC